MLSRKEEGGVVGERREVVPEGGQERGKYVAGAQKGREIFWPQGNLSCKGWTVGKNQLEKKKETEKQRLRDGGRLKNWGYKGHLKPEDNVLKGGTHRKGLSR